MTGRPEPTRSSSAAAVEIVPDELNVASGGAPRKLGFTGVGRPPIEPPSAEGTGTGVVWRLVR
jgi:hypothetical protein